MMLHDVLVCEPAAFFCKPCFNRMSDSTGTCSACTLLQQQSQASKPHMHVSMDDARCCTWALVGLHVQLACPRFEPACCGAATAPAREPWRRFALIPR